MTSDPISIPPDIEVNQAISIMLTQRIDCLPVVEEGHVCGIVTTTDLMMGFQSALRTLEAITTQLGVEPAALSPLDSGVFDIPDFPDSL